MNIILKSLLFTLFAFSLLPAKSQNWQQVNDFPSSERDDGTAFAIGSKACCGSGYLPWFAVTGDFYSFNMHTDLWSAIAALPAGKERQYATGFSSDTFGFVFGGIAGTTYLNDLWRYDTLLNSWTEKAALPSVARRGAASFAINNMAYIIGGTTASDLAIDEVWAYDMIHDAWQSKNNLPFGSRARACAVSQNNKGYLIFGRDENGRFCPELYEYDPVADSWVQLSSFPDGGRSYSTLSSFKGDLIVVAGIDTFATTYNDMWRFIPGSSTWQQLNSIPSTGRKGGMCFNDSTAIYYTTGITQSSTRLKETWKCTNPTGVIKMKESTVIKLYPNPANEFCVLELTGVITTDKAFYTLFDYTGKMISEEHITENRVRINLSGFAKGLYLIKLHYESGSATMKLVKE